MDSPKIDIFNVMTEEELDEELNNSKNTRREYQRIVAMKFISLGIHHNLVAEGIGVDYRTINRWAHACNEGGLANLNLILLVGVNLKCLLCKNWNLVTIFF